MPPRGLALEELGSSQEGAAWPMWLRLDGILGESTQAQGEKHEGYGPVTHNLPSAARVT